MPNISKIISQTLDFINPYLNQKYFLYLIGSIFLLGIVGEWVSRSIYSRLIKKAENMVSPKNKMLKQIKLKFENCIAVNGVVANPALMVERYIKKYKFWGITLGGFSKITNICAVLCVALAGIAGFAFYELDYGKTTAMSYILVGCFFAFALDVYSRSVSTKDKENELVCIITDFLENTLNCKARRQSESVLITQTQVQTDIDEINKLELSGTNNGNNSNEAVMEVSNVYAQKGDKTDLDSLKEQEYIINEVLGEFL